MVVVAVSVLLMITSGLMVISSVLIALVLVGLRELGTVVARIAAKGLVPSTFVLPDLPGALRPRRATAAGQGAQEAYGQGAPA